MWVDSSKIVPEVPKAIEGSPATGDIKIKRLCHGENVLLLWEEEKKGAKAGLHKHQHESAFILLEGRRKMNIAGREHIFEKGHAWLIKPGVEHDHEALEDCKFIEAKSPPQITW
ncbi:MAG: cupin domain-containing protein [Nitrososphaeria archaeon]|nr:cupin domain-containing protein [Nitrososphaeria archaeon]NIQ34129.1 cupin domain-containing protein [Nitrososphaeria archaeon]